MLDPSKIEEVLDQVARGNRDAFRQVVRAYSLPLRSFIASQVHHMDEVAIYDHPLSADKIGEHFGLAAPRPRT
jgi:hypothetical protein